MTLLTNYLSGRTEALWLGCNTAKEEGLVWIELRKHGGSKGNITWTGRLLGRWNSFVKFLSISLWLWVPVNLILPGALLTQKHGRRKKIYFCVAPYISCRFLIWKALFEWNQPLSLWVFVIQLTGTYNLMLNCFLFALFFNIGDADDRGIHQNFDSTPASPSFKKGSTGAKRVTPDWPATRIASTATQPPHPSRPPKEPSNTAVNMNSCLFVCWNAQNGKLWSVAYVSLHCVLFCPRNLSR